MRRRMMMGKALPYDAEIEYLESTGTQYIDTGIIVSLDTKVELGVSCLFKNTRLLSTRTGNWRNQFEIIPYNTQKGFIFRLAGNGTNQQKSYGNTINWERYDIVMSADTTTVNGNNTSGTFNTDDINNPNPLILLAGGGDIYGLTPTIARIYTFKIYEKKVLVADFVPVRKDKTGYLYDKVSGELFGNSGIGDFLLGHDKVNP